MDLRVVHCYNMIFLSSTCLPTNCSNKCLNQFSPRRTSRTPSSSGVRAAAALKKMGGLHDKDLSRILRTEAAVDGIERKAAATSPKYRNLSPKPLIEALHQAIELGKWDSALSIFGLLRKQHWYKPRCQTYTKLMMMLSKCRKPDKAGFLFDMLMSDGLKPTVDVFTALINAYAISGLFDQAFSILDDMKSVYDCRPDVHTYSVLLNCCVKRYRFDLVDHVLDEMSYLGIEYSTVTYNIVIDGFGKAKMFDSMENMLLQMTEAAKCHPDVFTFNSFVWAYGNRGRIRDMERWYQEFQLMGISPDVRTFNILISSYGKAGMYEKMESVLDFMEKRFFSPSVVTFNTIIDIYGRAGDVDKSDEFFLKMKHRGVKPNTVTFCSMVNVYSQTGKLYRVDSILRQIHNSDVVLDTAFFNCVINAYGRAGNIDKMREMLVEMTERKCEPDHITIATILQVYDANGMTDAAEEVKSKMLQC